MNAIVTIPATARDELTAAQRIRDVFAESATTSAEAVLRARAFVASLEFKTKAFANLDAKVAAERAASMKAAMARGEAPKFDISPELAAAAAEKMEIENQILAARAGLNELQREAEEAAERLAAARVEVGRKIEAVVLEVTAAMAARINALEAEALEARALLEGSHNHHRVEGVRPIGFRIHDDVRRILQTNTMTQVGITNTPLNLKGKASHGRWKDFIAALEGDPNAAF